MKISAIITCAGSGTRMGFGINKLRYEVSGLSIFEMTLQKFLRDDISQIIITSSDQDLEFFKDKTKGLDANIKIVSGAETRAHSVANAIFAVDKDTDLVIIHDGARPFVSKEVIDDAIKVAKDNGSAIACSSPVDSIREVIDYDYTESRERSHYLLVQTPQVFKYDSILRAYTLAQVNNDFGYRDDASLYEHYIGKVYISRGDRENIKITTRDDLYRLVPKHFFVGCGWDTHELVEGRKLILGGIDIPHTKGLLGHSDADVLTHAIMDALLCASNNKDIGHLFPDTDPKYKGISSLLLLEEVVKILKNNNYVINNITAVIMAQKPKLAPHLDAMRAKLAEIMGIDVNRINLTSTTTEKLGLVGHEEAISVNAYCSLYKD